jgi:hypothetical protein
MTSHALAKSIIAASNLSFALASLFAVPHRSNIGSPETLGTVTTQRQRSGLAGSRSADAQTTGFSIKAHLPLQKPAREEKCAQIVAMKSDNAGKAANGPSCVSGLSHPLHGLGAGVSSPPLSCITATIPPNTAMPATAQGVS